MVDDSDSGDLHDHVDQLNAVIAALKGLDRDRRIRLLQTVATFFDLPHYVPSIKPYGTVSEPQAASGYTVSNNYSEDRTKPPKAFLFEKQPVTDVDRVACLAYYLAHFRSTPHFKTLDISKLNTEAAQLKFANAAYAVDNAAKAGLLVPAAKGQKQLSAVGERYVEALPDKGAAREIISKAGRKKRGKSRPSTSSVQDATIDDISTEE